VKASRRAAIYVRISDDRAGDAAGVGRQEADSRELASRLGWDVGQIFAENDTSAFKRRKVRLPDGTVAMRVVRPVFRQMLDALAFGSLDALVAYDLDRIARDPRDLEDLIDLVETHRIPARTVTGSLDLGNDAGVTMARVLLAMANKSSRDTARRVVRKQQEMAEQGAYAGGGIRSYGYEADGITVNMHEAEVVNDIAGDILNGYSLSSIASYLNDGEEPTVRGGPWSARSVHAVVSKPRNVAKRVYQGEVVGDATWPAILNLDTWERVRIVLAERARGGNNILVRWLTGVLRCSLCDATLRGKHTNNGPVYWCATPSGGCGKIAIAALPTEAWADDHIPVYLSRPDVLASLTSATSDTAATKARADAEADQAQLKELATLWGARNITTVEYLAARREIEDRLKMWREIARAAVPESVRSLIGADIAYAWKIYEPKQRQEVAKVVFPDGIRVEPATMPFRFNPGRLVPIWRA
jgi:site-specific DNA recombinase